MTTKPKAIGTKAETAVKKILLPYFPEARRNALAGSKDEGDIGGCGDFIFEVKGGAAAKNINSPVEIDTWMGQAGIEALNAKKPYGVLVTQRQGYGEANAHRWWVWIQLQDLANLLGSQYLPDTSAATRLELGDFLNLLNQFGYTDIQPIPLDVSA